ncbi:MAG: hypothetical protein ABIF77_07425 [bacterium]
MNQQTIGSSIGGLFGRGGFRKRSLIGIEAGVASARVAARQQRGRSETWLLSALDLDSSPILARGDPPTRAAAPGAKSVVHGSAICALNSDAVNVFPLSLRPTESQPLEQLMVNQARDHLGEKLEDLVIDYSVVPEAVRRPGNDDVTVLVFAVSNTVVNELLHKLQQVRLEVDRLLTPACVLAPWVARADDQERHLLFATAEEATSVAIVQHGHVLLERLVPWGIGRLVERMRQELALSDGQCRLLLDPPWLSPAGSEGESDFESQTDSPVISTADTLRRILEPDFQELARQAAGCLGYCDSYYRPAEIVAATVVGPMAEFSPLQEVLKTSLGIPARGPEEGLTLPAVVDQNDTASYTTAACCALWPERQTT